MHSHAEREERDSCNYRANALRWHAVPDALRPLVTQSVAKCIPSRSVRNETLVTIVPMLCVGMPFRTLCVLPVQTLLNTPRSPSNSRKCSG